MSAFNGLGKTPINPKSLESSLASEPQKSTQAASTEVHNPMAAKDYRDFAPFKQGVSRNDVETQGVSSVLARWFYNLPVRRKFLLGLMAPGVFSILALVAAQHQLFVAGEEGQGFAVVAEEVGNFGSIAAANG